MSKVIERLKQIQADSIVFYMKVHNLHWNVKGTMFKPIHESTEEIYNKYAEIFDNVAERIIQLDGKPIVTLSEALKTSKIKEETSTSFKPEQVLKIILADDEYFLKSFKKLSNVADEENDKVTADYANDIVAELEKSIWMIKAQLG